MKRCLILLSMAMPLLFLQPALYAQKNTSSLRKTTESLMVDAVQKYEDGNFKEAEAIFSVIIDASPENDAAYYYKGLCDLYMGNTKDAEAELREAVRLDPDNYWYRDRLAVLYSMTGQDELTISIYESLLESYPRKTEIYYNLVNLYAGQGRMDKVIETLDTIETVSGKDESTVLARYEVLMRMDKADEAFKVLEAFNEDYSSPQVLSMMADAKLTEDKDSLALAYYNEALSLEPDYAPALVGKSEVYRMTRKYDEYFKVLRQFTSSAGIPAAMKSQYLSSLTDHLDARFITGYKPQLDSLFESGVQAHPADSSMLLTAGTYFFRSDSKDRAKELFKKNSEIYPDDFGAAAMYIQSLSYSDDWVTLAQAADDAFARFPEEPAFLNMKIAAHFNLDDYQAVIDDCGQMIESFPDNPAVLSQAYSTIGDVRHEQNDEKQAFKAYEKALKLTPDYAPVLNNYAYYLSLKGKKLKKAYNMSKVTVEQEPDNPTYLDTFAWILHLQKKNLEAKSFFKHAMLYGGKDSATILNHYAEVLEALGEDDLAKVYRDMAAKKTE